MLWLRNIFWKSHETTFLLTIDVEVFPKILVKHLELYFKGNKRSIEKLRLDFTFDDCQLLFNLAVKNIERINWKFLYLPLKSSVCPQNVWDRNTWWCKGLRKFLVTGAGTQNIHLWEVKQHILSTLMIFIIVCLFKSDF